MIDYNTIQRIIDTAEVTEVIQDKDYPSFTPIPVAVNTL